MAKWDMQDGWSTSFILWVRSLLNGFTSAFFILYLKLKLRAVKFKKRESKKLIRFSFISAIASIEISGCEDLLGAFASTVFRKWNQVFLKFCPNILKN